MAALVAVLRDDEDGSDTDEEFEDMLFDAVIAHLDVTRQGAKLLYPSSMWVKEPWTHMEAGEFERWTNFTPNEIIRLDSLLTRCPATIIGSGSFHGRNLPCSHTREHLKPVKKVQGWNDPSCPFYN